MRRRARALYLRFGAAGFETRRPAPQIVIMGRRVIPGSDREREPDGFPVPPPVSERPGPVAALILFLALFFGAAAPGAASPGNGTGDPLSRVSTARQGRQAPARGAFEQDRKAVAATQAQAEGSAPPPPPAIVSKAIFFRPAGETARSAFLSLPRLRAASYRARAPPAA
jgi:hypothetical protein